MIIGSLSARPRPGRTQPEQISCFSLASSPLSLSVPSLPVPALSALIIMSVSKVKKRKEKLTCDLNNPTVLA